MGREPNESDSAVPVPLQVPGLTTDIALYIHGQQDQFVSRKIGAEGIWEPFETSLVQHYLGPGAVFVDVGANIGYFSILAATIVGDEGAVCAFEPDPDNMRLLRASAEYNGLSGRISAIEAGLSDAGGDGSLYLSEDNLGDHQIYPDRPDRDALPITLYHGSEFLAHRLTKMDLLKVDTQGSEYRVMAGLLPLLQGFASCPRIIIELTPYSLNRAGASGRALIELLAELRQPFWIVDHVEHRLVASNAAELGDWCDNVDAVPGDRGFMNIMLGPE
jgi:FkbM family methyltransferase